MINRDELIAIILAVACLAFAVGALFGIALVKTLAI